jgi:hypothetical protein
MGRKFPTIKDGLRSQLCCSSFIQGCIDLHVVVVSFNGEREAAVNLGVISSCRRCRGAQGTARQHSFLLLIKTDGTEFLPIADQLILHDNLMDGKLTLDDLLAIGRRRHESCLHL